MAHNPRLRTTPINESFDPKDQPRGDLAPFASEIEHREVVKFGSIPATGIIDHIELWPKVGYIANTDARATYTLAAELLSVGRFPVDLIPVIVWREVQSPE